MFLNVTLNKSGGDALFVFCSDAGCWQHCLQIHNISDMWDVSS